jgi:hypothetical protein
MLYRSKIVPKSLSQLAVEVRHIVTVDKHFILHIRDQVPHSS